MKTVLVAVLDWGLGHATRCIPIIQELIKQQAEVLVAGNGRSLQVLKQEFPNLLFLDLPDYQIRYSSNHSMVLSMAKQLPHLLRVIRQEHTIIQQFVNTYKVDLILSDNRYGCYHTAIKSVIICHQLNLQMPRYWHWAARLVNVLHLRLLKKFNTVWIPDMPEERSLTGELSKNNSLTSKHIGILSRFTNRTQPAPQDSFKIVAIISGPEPQRSIFEELVLDQLQSLSVSALVIRGLPEVSATSRTGELTVVNHLPADQMGSVLQQADVIIARSGYSTIMDLVALNKRAILIPTPGQTEQEYLAAVLMKKQWALVQSQSEMNLRLGLETTVGMPLMPLIQSNILLPKAIAELL
jgi:predicted glycosyltransferase